MKFIIPRSPGIDRDGMMLCLLKGREREQLMQTLQRAVDDSEEACRLPDEKHSPSKLFNIVVANLRDAMEAQFERKPII